MSDAVETAHRTAEMYTLFAELELERALAFETRREDPDRWNAAKHKYAETRRFFRLVRVLGPGDVVPETAGLVGVAHEPTEV